MNSRMKRQKEKSMNRDDTIPMDKIGECRKLMLQGLSVPQISRITNIKQPTVKGYVRKILADEGVSSRLELLAFEIERLRKELKNEPR